MPPIFRHIVPNVPDKAGNGSPCYRGNAPSCQALMKMSVEWDGDIDFGGYHGYEPSVTELTAAEINEAIANWAQTWDATFYYNGTSAGSVTGLESYIFFNPGTYRWSTKSLLMHFEVGIFWDASSTSWQWGVAVRTMSPSFANGHAPNICARSHLALFTSAPSTQNIRLGNGVTLAFDSFIVPWAGSDAWKNTSLANCSITVSAQYA